MQRNTLCVECKIRHSSKTRGREKVGGQPFIEGEQKPGESMHTLLPGRVYKKHTEMEEVLMQTVTLAGGEAFFDPHSPRDVTEL